MEKLIPPIAFVLAIGLLYCLHLVRRGRLETDELTNALSASFLRNWTLTNELHAIREARSNGVTYTADQVADWLRNLEAFASIGKLMAIKITGLWEVKAKHDADKAEKCISCRNAITRDGCVLFIPPRHRICMRCIVEATISKLQGEECHSSHEATIELLKEAVALPNEGHDVLSNDYDTRPDESIGTSPQHKEVKPVAELWESVAYWPKGTFDGLANITTDWHYTREAALAVCKLLERNGAGGEGKVFPERTETRLMGRMEARQ